MAVGTVQAMLAATFAWVQGPLSMRHQICEAGETMAETSKVRVQTVPVKRVRKKAPGFAVVADVDWMFQV